MLQISKLCQSRNDWRKKAVERADEIRENRKTISRHKQTILELKHEIKGLKKSLNREDKKKAI